MEVFRMFVKALIFSPLKIKYLASDHAIMDYVRYALIGFTTDSDLVSQIYREPFG
jgi:hypothetical protein